jgi:hypothetical protein
MDALTSLNRQANCPFQPVEWHKLPENTFLLKAFYKLKHQDQGQE